MPRSRLPEAPTWRHRREQEDCWVSRLWRALSKAHTIRTVAPRYYACIPGRITPEGPNDWFQEGASPARIALSSQCAVERCVSVQSFPFLPCRTKSVRHCQYKGLAGPEHASSGGWWNRSVAAGDTRFNKVRLPCIGAPGTRPVQYFQGKSKQDETE